MGVLLLCTSAVSTAAQQVQFSTDMQLFNGTARTETVKLSVGDRRVRIDRPIKDGDANQIGSIIVDFGTQGISFLIPQSKTYMRLAGSLGMPFYDVAWTFRPESKKWPCNAWVREADKRGITLRCKSAGQDIVDGRTTEKWDATSPQGGHGSIWYDPRLNFIVRVQRTSKDGVQSGYVVEHVKEEPQPEALFKFPSDYRELTLDRLIDALTKLGDW